MQAWARRVLDLAVRQGTTAMRSHAEVDPIVGLMGLEALAALKREYAPAIDLQLCAFAQEGILQAPGTEALLREALRAGADLVGGVPYNDTDARRLIDVVLDLAFEFGVEPTSTPTSSTSRSTCTRATSRRRRCGAAGLRVGAPADLVVWDTERPEDVLTALSPCRLAVKTGRVTVEHARSVAEPWRERSPRRADST